MRPDSDPTNPAVLPDDLHEVLGTCLLIPPNPSLGPNFAAPGPLDEWRAQSRRSKESLITKFEDVRKVRETATRGPCLIKSSKEAVGKEPRRSAERSPARSPGRSLSEKGVPKEP